jgi:hypothetical protein
LILPAGKHRQFLTMPAGCKMDREVSGEGMKKVLLSLILLMSFVATGLAQPSGSKANGIEFFTSLPGSCQPGQGRIIGVTAATPVRYYICTATNVWTEYAPGINLLTDTRIPFGSPSNTPTESADFTFNNTTKRLVINSAAAAYVDLTAVSTTAAVRLNNAAHPGSGGGFILPFVGGNQADGPGLWWCQGAYASCSGIWLNLGLNWQGAGGAHSPVKFRTSTGTSSNGTIRFQFEPDASIFTQIPSTGVTGVAHVGEVVDLSSTGTPSTNFGFARLVKLENGAGSQVNATQVTSAWAAATAGAETGRYSIATNLAGTGLGDAFSVEGNQYYGTTFSQGNVSGAVTINFNNSNNVAITLTGNITSMTFQNLRSGGQYFLKISQNATGGHTWTPSSSNFLYPGGTGGNILTTTTNATDLFTCISFDGVKLICNGLFDVK